MIGIIVPLMLVQIQHLLKTIFSHRESFQEILLEINLLLVNIRVCKVMWDLYKVQRTKGKRISVNYNKIQIGTM